MGVGYAEFASDWMSCSRVSREVQAARHPSWLSRCREWSEISSMRGYAVRHRIQAAGRTLDQPGRESDRAQDQRDRHTDLPTLSGQEPSVEGLHRHHRGSQERQATHREQPHERQLGSPAPAVTVTVAAPPPAQPAYPAVELSGQECGRTGTAPFAAVAAGNSVTSCPFALNVQSTFVSGPAGTPATLEVYSPVTSKIYVVTCTGTQPVICTGGNSALIYLYGGTATFRG